MQASDKTCKVLAPSGKPIATYVRTIDDRIRKAKAKKVIKQSQPNQVHRITPSPINARE